MIAIYNGQSESILKVLREIIDPEVGVNIVDLGLIYRATENYSDVIVEMTMTSPTCPLGDWMVMQVRSALEKQFPQKNVKVFLGYEPPWQPENMSDDAKRILEGRKL